MSFLKIINLPPVPVNKLRDLVRYQMVKIYPGNTEDISFDFVPFKGERGWRIILYILKKNYLKELIGNKCFGGIILPLQLLTVKELQGLSNLIIYYPDMVEIWKFTNGLPQGVVRHDSRGSFVQISDTQENVISGSGKVMTIYPYNEIHEWEMKNGRTKKFSEALDSMKKYAIYFPEYKVKTIDSITTLVVITAFIISIVFLGLIAQKYTEFIKKERAVNTWIGNIKIETDQNREALEIISELKNELLQIGENLPINVYNLILQTRNVLDSNTEVLSFGLNGKEMTLDLRSGSAVDTLSAIKEEFGNVRSSNIRALDNGFESYTIWVEITP